MYPTKTIIMTVHDVLTTPTVIQSEKLFNTPLK